MPGVTRASGPPRRRSMSSIASTRTPRGWSVSPRPGWPNGRCTACSSATKRRAPIWPSPRGRWPPRESSRAWSPIAETVSAVQRIGPAKASTPSPTSRRCVRSTAGMVGPACSPRSAAFAWKPGARTRFEFIFPSAGIRWSVRRFTSVTFCAAAERPSPPRGSCCTRPCSGFPHPVTGEPIELRAAPPADYLAVLESLGGTADDCHV